LLQLLAVQTNQYSLELIRRARHEWAACVWTGWSSLVAVIDFSLGNLTDSNTACESVICKNEIYLQQKAVSQIFSFNTWYYSIL